MNKLDEAIEQLIDANTLGTVLDSISRVCVEKAEHLRSAWGDSATGKNWDSAATKVYSVACKAFRNGL